MRLKISLLLAFLTLTGVQAVVVFPWALNNIRALLAHQQETRIDNTLKALEVAFQRMQEDASNALLDLAQNEGLVRALREARETPDAFDMSTWAESTMTSRRLSVLAILDASGKTLSSGHLPARLGDVDETLLELALRTTQMEAVQVLVPAQAGLVTKPALVRAVGVDVDGLRFWVVGGFLLDEAMAGYFKSLSNAEVEVLWEDTVLLSTGLIQGPLTMRSLPWPPSGKIRFLFGQQEAQEAQQRVLGAFGAIFLLGVALALTLAFWFATRLTRPLEALTQAVEQVAKGQWAVKVEAAGSREVSTLVQSVNHMSEALKTTTERLLATERIAAWQDVAKKVAHEIKNPLTPIQMSLETLVAARQSQHPRFFELFSESAGPLLEEVQRLKRIVDEFSRFARLPKPHLQPLDVAAITRELASMYPSFQEGVKLKLDVVDRAFVLADRDQLTQVLLNLLKNANEAMPQGGTVKVRVFSEGAFFAVEVADEGPGIALEARQRIFEPYFTTKEGGTGLGLAISARMAHEHGGRLEVGGIPGRGAIFTLWLPKP